MLQINDRMALLDANLGGDSRSSGSDEVFYRPSHPMGGGAVVDSGLYERGAAENDSESTLSTALSMSTGVVSSSTVTPSSMLTNAGDWTDLDQLDDQELDLDGLMVASATPVDSAVAAVQRTGSEGGCHSLL